MIVLGVAAKPALPVPLERAVVPRLDDGAQKLTSERVHGLTHPQLTPRDTGTDARGATTWATASATRAGICRRA